MVLFKSVIDSSFSKVLNFGKAPSSKGLKTKKAHISVSLSTQSRSRTGTSVTSLVFETNASTNSAIWAFKSIPFLAERAANMNTKMISYKLISPLPAIFLC